MEQIPGLTEEEAKAWLVHDGQMSESELMTTLKHDPAALRKLQLHVLAKYNKLVEDKKKQTQETQPDN
jgi:hypothetical protein